MNASANAPETGKPKPRRATVNFTRSAADDLDLAMELGGESLTDTINRAVREHAYRLRIKHQGGGFLVQETPGAEPIRVEFL